MTNATILHSFFDDLDFEEGGLITLDQIEFREDSEINFALSASKYNEQTEERISVKLSVNCCLVLDYKLTKGHIELPHRYSEHPMLWRFTKSNKELYAAKGPNDQLGLLKSIANYKVAFWREHDVGTSSVMVHDVSLKKLIAFDFGKLAEGVSFVIDEYYKILKTYGMKPSTISTRSPVYWHPKEQWKDIDFPLQYLDFGKAGWVICKDITVNTLDTQSEPHN